MKSGLDGCGTCHWWMKCSELDKRKQEASNEACPDWKRLATEGIESGWS